METLKCLYAKKPHNWKREATRGRKPQFCPKHKPEVPVTKSSGTRTLHCKLGNHSWEREPTRGRVPENCPEHKPLIVAPPTVQMNEAGEAIQKLHCERGNHDWERKSQRGKKPTNCPEHPPVAIAPRPVPVVIAAGSESGDVPSPRKPGRPKLYESDEEKAAAALARSTMLVNRLEDGLKARGTHISQQAPYILYKRTDGPTKRGKVTWDKVTEHSPLQRQVFLNEHEKDFLEKRFRYEREGVPVIH